MFKRSISAACVLACGGIGCTMPSSESHELLGRQRASSSSTTAPWYPIGAGSHAEGVVGIGYTDAPYVWLDNGIVCRSVQSSHPCADNDSVYKYSAPEQYADIRAVGIALHTSGHVYAWYANRTVSQGTSDNLSAYFGEMPFTPATKPNGTSFTMDELIDVDNPDNSDNWYYYWCDGCSGPAGSAAGGTVYLTWGTPYDAAKYYAARPVTISSQNIAGISFAGDGLQVWYADLAYTPAPDAKVVVIVASGLDLTVR